MTAMWRKISTGIGNERGTNAVELALLLPVLVMLMVGIFQFGMAYNNYLAITHAAREGARLAAVNRFDEAAVREKAYPVNPDSVSVSYPAGEAHGEPVTVTVTYNRTIDVPFWGSVVIPLNSEASMRIEY